MICATRLTKGLSVTTTLLRLLLKEIPMPDLRLIYFKMRALAEAPQLMLHYTHTRYSYEIALSYKLLSAIPLSPKQSEPSSLKKKTPGTKAPGVFG